MNIREHLADCIKRYEASASSNHVNFLIYGHPGSGKTRSIATARKPIYIFSFDPGGSVSIRNQVGEASGIYVDTSFESDDPKRPTAFADFIAATNKLGREFFNAMGTVAIDSGTMFFEAMMRDILKRDGKPSDATPQLQHYLRQQVLTTQVLTDLCAQPCDFILTGHIEIMQDETDGKLYHSLMVSGKNKVKIPALFNEVWIAECEEIRSKGESSHEYSFITRPSGRGRARSRIESLGNLPTKIPQDISAALKACGYPTNPKEETPNAD